jgi:hypothetical protein
MARWHWLWVLFVVCLLAGGCDKSQHKKPDPTKGTVTGIVLCADTGKPARFATVTLSAAPKTDAKIEQGNPLPATEITVTDLEGRFRFEAVEPGNYYAFATLEGYLDPMRGLDFLRLSELDSDQAQELDAIKQWKDHLTKVTVQVHRTADLALQVERGAEIDGTVTFDDGSPSIGMHFQLLRKTERNRWAGVGLALFQDWSIPAVSDGHGRFSLTNLTAGEYTVCALMPSETENAALRICLGNVLREKGAKTVKVQAGEIASGANIEIPLSGLYTVAGTVSALADGHALGRGTVRLLYADDREKARELPLAGDGGFSFQYVAEGKYILAVSGAQDAEPKSAEPGPAYDEAVAQKAAAVSHYADKELPVTVISNMDDIQILLAVTLPDKPQAQ